MWQKSVTKIELFPLVRSGIRAEMREEQQTVMYKAAPVRLSKTRIVLLGLLYTPRSNRCSSRSIRKRQPRLRIQRCVTELLLLV